jgi:capsid protein
MNDLVSRTVEQAVEQAWADWAALHPNLAGVINRMVITQRTVTKLRESDAFARAVADYYRSRNEMNLLNELLAQARPLLGSLLSL